MGAKKMFSMLQWSGDQGERTPSIYSIRAGGKARADSVVTGVEIGGGGISKVELLWLDATTEAQKRDLAFSTISIF